MSDSEWEGFCPAPAFAILFGLIMLVAAPDDGLPFDARGKEVAYGGAEPARVPGGSPCVTCPPVRWPVR